MRTLFIWLLLSLCALIVAGILNTVFHEMLGVGWDLSQLTATVGIPPSWNFHVFLGAILALIGAGYFLDVYLRPDE